METCYRFGGMEDICGLHQKTGQSIRYKNKYIYRKMCNFYGWIKIELVFGRRNRFNFIHFACWSKQQSQSSSLYATKQPKNSFSYVNLKLYLNWSSKWFLHWLIANQLIHTHTQFFKSLSADVVFDDDIKCHIRLAPAATIYNNLSFSFVIENTEKFMLCISVP